ncbi:hypothetical protein E3H11_16320 [Bradyrhizobium brasilense]|uniref:hypothetical protein n=1 Tax=Bradyrhizobium brasilense TaxID=1419277 RepID=UPI001456A2C1|nr:hypothetical protein [Bradyrhizobium brasilense]NLS70461.1 hypothetical protein [Bradyrhizobium brasilense]
MGFGLQGQTSVSNFFNAIEPWESGYQNNTFTYVAVRRGERFLLVQGSLWLNTSTSPIPLKTFESENVRAGHFKISDVGKTFREMIEDLGDSEIQTPQGPILFPSMMSYQEASFTPLHPSALQSQSRVNVLKITGDEQSLTNGPSVLDWELRSCSVPYDSIQELLQEFGLGGLFTDQITVEVVATSVMGFDGDQSKITGEKAQIVVRLANTLNTNEAAVGFREINQGGINRGVLRGAEFAWTQTDRMQIGRYELDVRKASILHCYAVYNKVAQTHWYISDPTTSQNPRRVIVESFDAGLAILTEFLGRPHSRGQDARDFEVAIAWLFWILGFSTVHLGSTTRTQDFSDLVLTTPQERIAVVECTTGLLKADNKLPKLIARYATLRQRLDQANNKHLKLLPVMVSPLNRVELQADLEQAERLGVLVLAKEQLERLMLATLMPSNPDDLYLEAEKRLRTVQESLNAKTATDREPELPLQ